MFKRIGIMVCFTLLAVGFSMVFADSGTVVGEPAWVTKALAALGTIGAIAGSPFVLLFFKKAKIVAQESQDLRDAINAFIFLYQDIVKEIKDQKVQDDAKAALEAVAKVLEDTTITSLQKKAALVRALEAKFPKAAV